MNIFKLKAKERSLEIKKKIAIKIRKIIGYKVWIFLKILKKRSQAKFTLVLNKNLSSRFWSDYKNYALFSDVFVKLLFLKLPKAFY